jgi:hypothetical protein
MCEDTLYKGENDGDDDDDDNDNNNNNNNNNNNTSIPSVTVLFCLPDESCGK